jgi:hypothetical protein
MKDVMNRFLNGRQQTDVLAMFRRLMHHILEPVQVRVPKWFLTPFSPFQSPYLLSERRRAESRRFP